MRYVLGLDIGTHAVKVGLFDLSGRLLAMESVDLVAPGVDIITTFGMALSTVGALFIGKVLEHDETW